MYWEIVRLFREWAHVSVGTLGVSLPALDAVRRAIVLGQTFEWQRTGTRYKLVIARDHLRCSEDDYDKIEIYVFICAEVNFSRNGENENAYRAVSEKALEFGLLVDDYLIKKGVAEELRAYDFRKG